MPVMKGEKLPPCNKAVITLVVETPEGEARIRHNLFLHSRTEGMTLSFYRCELKSAEPLKMDWPRVVGRKGRAKIGIRMHDGKQYNEIKRFYDPENTAATAPTAAAPQQQNLYQGQPQAAPPFRPGAF